MSDSFVRNILIAGLIMILITIALILANPVIPDEEPEIAGLSQDQYERYISYLEEETESGLYDDYSISINDTVVANLTVHIYNFAVTDDVINFDVTYSMEGQSDILGYSNQDFMSIAYSVVFWISEGEAVDNHTLGSYYEHLAIGWYDGPWESGIVVWNVDTGILEYLMSKQYGTVLEVIHQ